MISKPSADKFLCTPGGWKDFSFFFLRNHTRPHPLTHEGGAGSTHPDPRLRDFWEAGEESWQQHRAIKARQRQGEHHTTACLGRGSPARRWRLGGCSRPCTAGAHMPGLLRDVLAICSCQPGLGPGLCRAWGRAKPSRRRHAPQLRPPVTTAPLSALPAPRTCGGHLP